MQWKEKWAKAEALTARIQSSINAYHTLLERLSYRTLPCRVEESQRRWGKLRARRDREYERLMSELESLR